MTKDSIRFFAKQHGRCQGGFGWRYRNKGQCVDNTHRASVRERTYSHRLHPVLEHAGGRPWCLSQGTASPLSAPPFPRAPPFILSTKTLHVSLLLVVVWGILLTCSFIFWSMGVVPVCPASRKHFSQHPFPPEGACDRHPANQLRGGTLRPVLSPEALLPLRSSCKILEANVIARVRARSMSRTSLGPLKGFPLRGKSKYKKLF